MGMAYCIHWSLGMGSQWGRRLNGDAVLCSLIMKGPCHNGDGVLYSPVTGGRDLRGTSSQRGRRTVIKDHEGGAVGLGGDETFACRTCWTILSNRAALKNHIRRTHQHEAKVRFRDGVIAHIEHGEDGSFGCYCGKRILNPHSLQRHAMRYSGKPTVVEVGERERGAPETEEQGG